MNLFAAGGLAWLLAICSSRVGAYVVYIVYAAAATLPVLQHEWDLSGTAAGSIASAGAWGWAFLSLGIAGVGAVVSVVLLHRTPVAAALHGPITRPVAASAGAR